MARQLAAAKGQGWKATGFKQVAPEQADIEHGRFSLSEILDSAVRVAGTADIGPRFSVAAGVPAVLTGDSVNLGRILGALTGKTLDTIDASGLSAAVDVAGTLFDSGRRWVVLQFTVRPAGTGFTCEQAAQFLMRVCSETVAGPECDGEEVTVSISRLIDDMGGSIAVASVPGDGFALTFTSAFGVAPTSSGDQERTLYGIGSAGKDEERLRMPDGVERLQGARILLAEDHPVNQNLTREILTHAGCKVDVAADGQKTVDAVRDHAKYYDAIIMDVQMPLVDGFEATRIIREDLAKTDVPIIAMTANVIGDERDRCLAAGMNDFVPKPIHIPDLYAALIRCIERCRPGAEAGVDAPKREELADAAPPDDSGMPLPERLPGVDIAAGLGRAMGNRRLYAGLLDQFTQSNETLGADVGAAIAAGDLARARTLVHGLSSTSGNLGAGPLHAAAKALEKALSEPIADIGGFVATFRERLETVLDGILKSGIPASVRTVRLGDGALPLDRDEAVQMVEQFAALLDNQDMAAYAHLDKVLEMFGGRGQDAELQRLKARLDALEFIEARELLEKICRDIVA